MNRRATHRGWLQVCPVVLVAVLAGGLARPASGVIFGRAECEEQVSGALTLALPLEAAEVEPERLRGILSSVLAGGVPARTLNEDDPCAGRRKLQVNVAFGSRYQILDWLSQRRVDGGVVTPFALALLARDGVELVPLELGSPAQRRTSGLGASPDSGMAARPWRGPVSSVLRAGVWRGDRLEELPHAEDLWRTYREQLWCRALSDPSSGGGAGGELWVAEAERCREAPREPQIYRPVMPSHLSSGGFVVPVAGLGRWLDERMHDRLAGSGSAEGETLTPQQMDSEARLRAAFWRAFFEDLRLSLDHDPLDRLAPASGSASRPLDLRPPESGPEIVELLVSERPRIRGGGSWGEGSWGEPSQEENPAPASGPLSWNDDEGSPAELLVLLPSAQWTLAQEPRRLEQELPRGFPVLPGSDQVLLYRRQAPADKPEIVASWAAVAEPERYFGVRTFDFTADEALRLLRLHRRVVSDQRLALVLPGGGVKAAYQSVLLDELYGSRGLRNRRAEVPSAAGIEPLAIDQVVGTSGGSLIGYFVAQLDTPGRPLLSQVLWQRADGEMMSSTDVFGWLDQLRWLSLVVGFGVFCCVLAMVAMRRRSRAMRDRSKTAEDLEADRSAVPIQQPPAQAKATGILAAPSWRPAVMLGFGLLLVLTPLVVRWLSGDVSREQVPEIEGLLYAFLVWLAMLADQCLIERETLETPVSHPGFSVTVLVVAGSLLAALPVLVSLLSGGSPLPSSSFGLTYVVLVILAVFGGIAVPMRARRRRAGSSVRAVFGRAGLDALLCSGGILLLLALSRRLRGSMTSLPFFLGALALVVFVLGFAAIAYRRRAPRGVTRAQRLAYYPSMLGACALVALLTAPANGGASLFEMLRQPSALRVGSGSLVFVVGVLVLATGLVLALHYGGLKYQLEKVGGYALGLFVVLVHGLLTYVVVFLVTALPGLGVTMLELTWEFWLVLLAAATLIGLALVEWARRSKSRRTLVECLRQGLDFLCEHHPNGVFVPWRFLRLAAVAIIFLGWWNFVVAPALYGNSSAESFLRQVQERFQGELTGDGDDLLPHFRTTFVTPANKLETDGTRFFTFVPTEARCPSFGTEEGTGRAWFTYRVGSRWDGGEGDTLQAGKCSCFSASDPEFYSDVIFASGSPFPIFAAHRVDPLCGREPELMVDGGYSNNVPVEAARKLDAQQVLILRSSHPLGHPGASGWLGVVAEWVGEVPGQLIGNLGPLTSFLFERSQRSDRMSGRELLVVSMAPVRDHSGWPRLFDFRAEVVERMRRLACEDLGITEGPPCDAFVEVPAGERGGAGARTGARTGGQAQRIAMVESWGQPQVQITTEISEVSASVVAASPDPAAR